MNRPIRRNFFLVICGVLLSGLLAACSAPALAPGADTKADLMADEAYVAMIVTSRQMVILMHGQGTGDRPGPGMGTINPNPPPKGASDLSSDPSPDVKIFKVKAGWVSFAGTAGTYLKDVSYRAKVAPGTVSYIGTIDAVSGYTADGKAVTQISVTPDEAALVKIKTLYPQLAAAYPVKMDLLRGVKS